MTFFYTIAFIGNIQAIAGMPLRLGGVNLVPNTIDFTAGPAKTSATALIVNILLMCVFALQHSLMARPAFKKVWTKIVPKPVERSTYVLMASGTLILLFSFWVPMTDFFWTTSGVLATSLTALYYVGFGIVVCSIVVIDHLELLGLRQVIDNLSGKPKEVLPFVAIGPFKLCRHPIMLGLLISVWAAPSLTTGHLLFAVMTTVYILVALVFEEKDLVAEFGDSYRQYQRSTPRLMPTGGLGRKATTGQAVEDAPAAEGPATTAE